MDKATKELWVKALRSGDYAQGSGLLRSINDQYYCLGVLAEIKGVEWYGSGDRYLFEDNSDGIVDETHEALVPAAWLEVETQTRLAAYNDSGQSFAEIADEIERMVQC